MSEGDRPDALSRVRQARRQISAEWGDDPRWLVEHYVHMQQGYRDRLVRTPLSPLERPVDP